MIHKQPIKLQGEFSLQSTEAEWIRSMRDAGMSRDEITTAWMSRVSRESREAANLRIDYYLGSIDAEELLKHLSPKEPTSIVFHAKESDGYWLKAHGEDAEFNVLLLTPNLPIEDVQSLVNKHQKIICEIAHRNSHGAPNYPRQLSNNAVATPISMEDIKNLLD